MFDIIAQFFGYILNFIYNLVQNYGIAIILFTILLKLCMLPMNIKQQKTMKKTAKVQAELKELQKKYSNDPTRLQQEMIDLYKRENMGPLSGCFSSIIQMIIIISMFYLVSRPLTYMLQIDTEIINEYVTEIQAEASEKNAYQEIAIIREFAIEDERVNINMNFLGLDLSSVPTQNYSDWKVFIIPVLYVCTSIISMKMTTKMQQKIVNNKEEKSDEEEMVADMNKSMLYLMPVMSVSIALIAPLGLALYWLVNNLLMIVERIIIKKTSKEEVSE